MNDLDLLRPTVAFATVVDLGSFRAAADRLNLSPPYVSQMVSELEDRLGRQLLFRSTRRIALTADGEAFLPFARTMADAFADGMEIVRDRRRRLSGQLRVSAPTVLASPAFARLVTQFAADHPALRLEIDLDDHSVDPVAAQVDLAIRIGDPGDDARRARRLFATRGVVCCAPAAARGIHALDDLEELVWIRSPNTPSGVELHGNAGVVARLDPERQIVVNNAALIRSMLADGKGYALLPEFTIREAVRDGDLAVALPEWGVPDVGVHALYTERRTALSNARAFVDHLVASLATV